MKSQEEIEDKLHSLLQAEEILSRQPPYPVDHADEFTESIMSDLRLQKQALLWVLDLPCDWESDVKGK